MNLFVCIDVDDLERAIHFYEQALGLQVHRRYGNAFAEVHGAQSPLHLLQKPADQLRHYDRHWTPVHLDFRVDDIEAAVQRAVNGGAKLEKGITDAKWGRLANLSDPSVMACFVQLIGRGYDELLTSSPAAAPA